MNSLNKYSPYVLALLRIVAAYMFLLHGTDKVFGIPAVFGQQPLFSLFGIGGVIEIIGGVLLILGLFTRPVAFILSGQMAVAYFYVHASAANVLLPILNQGELAALYSLVFLFFFVHGAGAFALDNKLAKK